MRASYLIRISITTAIQNLRILNLLSHSFVLKFSKNIEITKILHMFLSYDYQIGSNLLIIYVSIVLVYAISIDKLKI